jgi:hypothetical protein
MKQGHTTNVDTSHNVQTVIDTGNGIITNFEATNKANDIEALSEMATEAKQILVADEITVLADKGYSDGVEIKKCNDENLTCVIAKCDPPDENDGYSLNNFTYDEEKDVYECPQKQILTHQRNTTRGKMEYKIY